MRVPRRVLKGEEPIVHKKQVRATHTETNELEMDAFITMFSFEGYILRSLMVDGP